MIAIHKAVVLSLLIFYRCVFFFLYFIRSLVIIVVIMENKSNSGELGENANLVCYEIGIMPKKFWQVFGKKKNSG